MLNCLQLLESARWEKNLFGLSRQSQGNAALGNPELARHNKEIIPWASGMPGSRELCSPGSLPTAHNYLWGWDAHLSLKFSRGARWRWSQKPERVSLLAVNTQQKHNLRFCQSWLFKEIKKKKKTQTQATCTWSWHFQTLTLVFLK